MRFTAEQHQKVYERLMKKAEALEGAAKEKMIQRANGFLVLSRMAEKKAREQLPRWLRGTRMLTEAEQEELRRKSREAQEYIRKVLAGEAAGKQR